MAYENISTYDDQLLENLHNVGNSNKNSKRINFSYIESFTQIFISTINRQDITQEQKEEIINRMCNRALKKYPYFMRSAHVSLCLSLDIAQIYDNPLVLASLCHMMIPLQNDNNIDENILEYIKKYIYDLCTNDDSRYFVDDYLK